MIGVSESVAPPDDSAIGCSGIVAEIGIGP
jgi:hypothetical protein